MNLNELVSKMIFDYPYIFGHRNQVLHYIYCVKQNGFKWKNGKLKCKNFPKPTTMKERIDKHIELFPDRIRENLIKEEYEELRSLRDGEFFIFPVDFESNINNIPDNIVIDYLDGVYEIIDIIENVDEDFHITYSKNEKNHYKCNLMLLKLIKKNLNERF